MLVLKSSLCALQLGRDMEPPARGGRGGPGRGMPPPAQRGPDKWQQSGPLPGEGCLLRIMHLQMRAGCTSSLGLLPARHWLCWTAVAEAAGPVCRASTSLLATPPHLHSADVRSPVSALPCCCAALNVPVAQHVQLLFSDRMRTRPGVLTAGF